MLDSAAVLFAHHGVSAVSLRDIAGAADVNVALINRYVGTREDLIQAVFTDLSDTVSKDLMAHPREQQTFERDSPLGRWLVIMADWMLTGQDVTQAVGELNPVRALADVIAEHNGLTPREARIRAAQIIGSGLGWRLFEPYLIAAAGLTDEAPQELRDELTAMHQRVGATGLRRGKHHPLP